MTSVQTRIDAYAASCRYTDDSRKIVVYALRKLHQAAGPDLGDINGWWSELSTTLAPTTLRVRHSMASGYCRWLIGQGLLERNPLDQIKPPKATRPNPVTFTPEEMDAIRAAAGSTRNRLMIELGWALGLRACEIARLQVGDVDLRRGYVEIHGKGDKYESLPLPPGVARWVRMYLREHPATAGPLIRDERWHVRGVSASWVSVVLSRIARQAGVKQAPFDGKGAHALRRTCATELLEDGASPSHVQRVLRHSTMRSLDHYLRRMNSEDLRPLLDARAV